MLGKLVRLSRWIGSLEIIDTADNFSFKKFWPASWSRKGEATMCFKVPIIYLLLSDPQSHKTEQYSIREKWTSHDGARTDSESMSKMCGEVAKVPQVPSSYSLSLCS